MSVASCFSCNQKLRSYRHYIPPDVYDTKEKCRGKPLFKKSLLPDGSIYDPPPRRLSASHFFWSEGYATGARRKKEA